MNMRIDVDNRCVVRDCIYHGQKTSPGCSCHRTREQMLETRLVELRDAEPADPVADLLKALERAEIGFRSMGIAFRQEGMKQMSDIAEECRADAAAAIAAAKTGAA